LTAFLFLGARRCCAAFLGEPGCSRSHRSSCAFRFCWNAFSVGVVFDSAFLRQLPASFFSLPGTGSYPGQHRFLDSLFMISPWPVRNNLQGGDPVFSRSSDECRAWTWFVSFTLVWCTTKTDQAVFFAARYRSNKRLPFAAIFRAASSVRGTASPQAAAVLAKRVGLPSFPISGGSGPSRP
jgi:hypothetical protein